MMGWFEVRSKSGANMARAVETPAWAAAAEAHTAVFLAAHASEPDRADDGASTADTLNLLNARNCMNT